MDTLNHTGTPQHSGRYPWGSGDAPQQRHKTFLGTVRDLEKKGISEVDVAKGLGIKTTELRIKKSLAKDKKTQDETANILKLKNKGYSNVAIGKELGIPEPTVRSRLNPILQQRSQVTKTIANMLKESVDKKGFIDVGIGVENHLGISRPKLKVAIALAKEDGYQVQFFKELQPGTGKYTSIMALAGPGVLYDAKNKVNVRLITDYSENGGKSFSSLEPICNINSKRIKIQYAEEGGKDKDGSIEIRRGVDELSLGEKRYAQVRIGVDGTHFLKGMAWYGDDFPEGIDIVYNTNKKLGTPKNKVFKTNEDDPDNEDNPFGSIVRQKHYIDSKGKEQLSALNLMGYKDTSGEEGAWGEWAKVLSSQMLSKQNPSLAKKQLGLSYDAKLEEFNEIMSLNNPAVQKHLLNKFADGCDSSAIHLKAAALPRQRTHVILPLPNMKDTEIYAPNYDNGEQVVLIRHPHGGVFEIPQLTVNNNNRIGKRLLGDAEDGVGINAKVAAKLSGADFDGDTVLVIPNPPSVGIKTSSSIKRLLDFDPQESYKAYEGMPKVGPNVKKGEDGFRKPLQMGGISNLITDMTIKGADLNEISRAVMHSMVVIDAEKHNLDYKRSYIENGIASLKTSYQGGTNRGASTLISRASSDKRVDPRKLKSTKNMTPEELTNYKEGKQIYESTPESYKTYKDSITGKKYQVTDIPLAKREELVKEGVITEKVLYRKVKSSKMAETDDAFTLSSGTPMEVIYATHANKLKALGNTARKGYIEAPRMTYSPSANKAYGTEVSSLKAKLNISLKNAPLERQALQFANAVIATKKSNNPNMEPDELKKMRGMEVNNARLRVGAKKEKIIISDKEWEAIQAGAVSNNVVVEILKNTDLNRIKQLATPRTTLSMTPAKTAKVKLMQASGKYTQAEIAAHVGVSVSTLKTIE